MFRNITLQAKLFIGLFPLLVFSAWVGLDAFLGTLLIGGVCTFFLARWITKPVRALSKAMDGAAKGKFGTYSNVFSSDEIGQLSQKFNRMMGTLSEQRELPESILRSLQDGVFVIDNQGIITDVNFAGEQTVGYDKAELIGKPLSLIFDPKSRSSRRKYVQA